MQTWSLTYSYLVPSPLVDADFRVTGETQDDVIAAVRAFAASRSFKHTGELELEDYSDEMHFFFRHPSGKRVRFMNLQFEG